MSYNYLFRNLYIFQPPGLRMFSALSHFIFGASSLFGSHQQPDGTRASTWRDKKLCFDLRSSDLELDCGEQLIGCFYPIEDVKGNQDELGLLKVTNLRLIWICCKKKKVNLSIGWRTVTLTYEHSLKDALCGSSSSLFVLSKYDSTKYEFVFSKKSNQADIWVMTGDGNGSGGGGGPDNWTAIAQLKKFCTDKPTLISHLSPMYLEDPFEVVFKVWQAYKQTHLFRHCRSNLTQLVASTGDTGSAQPDVPAAIAGGNTLKLSDVNKLPSEEIIETFKGVVQIESKSNTYVGALLLTNIRIIWIDNTLPMRNLSIPYIRVESIKIKQGNRLVISAHDYLASSTHVDFQVMSPIGKTGKATRTVGDQMQALYALYKSKPRYGPESCEESINYMSRLKPIEHFFDSLDNSTSRRLENLGPLASVAKTRNILLGPDGSSLSVDSERPSIRATGNQADEHERDIERIESDLDGYKSKLTSYLDEQPLDLDNEVIYSTDLGLAIEKPASGATLRSIWKMEI